MEQNLRSKRIVDATFGDLENFMDSYFEEHKESISPEIKQSFKVKGLKAIAGILNISEKTLSKLRRETHIFDNVIDQKGRIITADSEKLNQIHIK